MIADCRHIAETRPTKRRAFHSALDDAGGFVMPWRANVVNDPARDQRRAGSLVRCSAARVSVLISLGGYAALKRTSALFFFSHLTLATL
jgi:hypothetical protein